MTRYHNPPDVLAVTGAALRQMTEQQHLEVEVDECGLGYWDPDVAALATRPYEPGAIKGNAASRIAAGGTL